MEINEKQLRTQIREIILNNADPKDIINKPDSDKLKRNVYNEILTLKGYFEKKEEDETKIIKTVDFLLIALKKLKVSLNKSL